MKLWGLSAVALAACSSRAAAPPPPAEPPEQAAQPARPPRVAVLFERMVGGWERATPLFGPDGGITVGARQWSRDGAYLGRHAWAVAGQRHVIAMIGDAAHPMVLAADWNDGDGGSKLVVAAPHATAPAHATTVAHEFLRDNLTLAPNRAALAVPEGEELVVRAATSGAVLARAALGETEDAPRACWLDDTRVAWIADDGGAPVLRTLAIRTHAVDSTRLAAVATIAACDPGGGAAVVKLEAGGFGVLDLSRGAIVAQVAADAESEVAIGDHGARLAVASASTFTLYDRDGATLTSSYARPWHDRRPPVMAFSPDGQRLALVGPTLVVLGPEAEVRPRTPAPSFAFTLPRGFTEPQLGSEELEAWSYAQLPAPSGFVVSPAMFVRAVSTDAITDVIGVALEHDELAGVPGLAASDAELEAFGHRAMAQLFDNWAQAASEEGERDDTYTLKVGHTKGLPWVETRELWRDGCEPYDGYTRIVIDTDGVYVVRALTVPGGPIDDWLTRFFAIPFGVRTQTALRHGPRMGPC
jgi:hypothetical protein